MIFVHKQAIALSFGLQEFLSIVWTYSR